MKQNILTPIMTFMIRSYHSSSFFFRLISVSNNIFVFLRTALFALVVLFVNSCEEAPTQIGSELLPSSDFVKINSTDTLSVWSYTMYDSSYPTNSPAVGFVGNILDPYFGTTTAEFVSQLRISNKWNYGPVSIDSVKMNLKLLNVKGGSAGEGHFLRMSEIADLLLDTVYYSDNQTNTTGYEISVELPKLTPDTINNISVALPVEFGEYLIRDTTQFFYSTTKPDFRSYFKGLYFQMTSTSDPLMIGFSQVNSGSYNNYFVLYMHDTADVRYRYYFILDPVHPNASYNKFSRDFSTADADKMIEHINDYNYRDTLTYLQYLNGVYTKIVFPGLDSLKKVFSSGHVSINKARIIIPAYYDGDRFTVTSVPSSLRLRFDTLGVKNNVPDYNIDINSKFFDGTLHKADSSYYFNIPTYIQTYLEDKTDHYKPELEVYQDFSGLNSVILKGNASKTPVRFEMTYTRF